MEIEKYGFGIQFDTEKFETGTAEYHAFSLLYGTLSLNELMDTEICAGYPYTDNPNVYLIVFKSESYKKLRHIFELLRDDTAISLFLWDNQPFLDKNRLTPLDELIPYGRYDLQTGKLLGAPIDVYRITPEKKRADIDCRKSRLLFAPDSFKGTLSSMQAVRLLTLAARETKYRGAEILSMPMADGGEGTLSAVSSYMHGSLVTVKVHDALMNETDAQYAIINGDTALIEAAQSAGLTLIPEDKRNIWQASTYGVGEMILHAVNSGIRKVVLTLGGTATNDGGIGAAAALGVDYKDKNGDIVPLCGEGLIFVRDIDMKNVPESVKQTEFTLMCDVKNPLTGINGATFTFSPQKGANAQDMFYLECGMKNLRRYYNNHAGYDICKKEGAGAAGGLGACFITLFNAKVKSGIDTILDMYGFDEKAKTASLIVTGEGKFDNQTIYGGKAVSGILKRSGKTPVVIICGCCDDDAMNNTEAGVVSLVHSFASQEETLENASNCFYAAAVNMFRLLKTLS